MHTNGEQAGLPQMGSFSNSMVERLVRLERDDELYLVTAALCAFGFTLLDKLRHS